MMMMMMMMMMIDLKCRAACDTTCGHKAKDITPLIAWRREAWKEEALDDVLRKDERGPSSIRQTLELFQRRHWGKLLRDGMERIFFFFFFFFADRAGSYHPELNCATPLRSQLVIHLHPRIGSHVFFFFLFLI